MVHRFFMHSLRDYVIMISANSSFNFTLLAAHALIFSAIGMHEQMQSLYLDFHRPKLVESTTLHFLKGKLHAAGHVIYCCVSLPLQNDSSCSHSSCRIAIHFSLVTQYRR